MKTRSLCDDDDYDEYASTKAILAKKQDTWDTQDDARNFALLFFGFVALGEYDQPFFIITKRRPRRRERWPRRGLGRLFSFSVFDF